MGHGGFGIVIIGPCGSKQEYADFETHTTSNRMELQAVVRALQFTPEHAEIKVKTDSKYLLCSIVDWAPTWQRNGWKSYYGEPIKNKDLIVSILALASSRTISWMWVPGHKGIELNERVDYLARQASRRAEMQGGRFCTETIMKKVMGDSYISGQQLEGSLVEGVRG